MAVCWFCKNEIELKGRVMRNDACPSCGKDLHACVQCRFYAPDYHDQCTEPKAEKVKEKEKWNYCEFFEIRPAGNDAEKPSERDKAKAALENLFKK